MDRSLHDGKQKTGFRARDATELLECGDLSPLSAGDLSPSKVQARRAIASRWEASLLIRQVESAPKAVTSHRTPKRPLAAFQILKCAPCPVARGVSWF